MKAIFIGLFVFSLAYAPVYAFDALIMPQLESLGGTYRNADAIAQKAADTAQQ